MVVYKYILYNIFIFIQNFYWEMLKRQVMDVTKFSQFVVGLRTMLIRIMAILRVYSLVARFEVMFLYDIYAKIIICYRG